MKSIGNFVPRRFLSFGGVGGLTALISSLEEILTEVEEEEEKASLAIGSANG